MFDDDSSPALEIPDFVLSVLIIITNYLPFVNSFGMIGRSSPLVAKFWKWTCQSRPTWRENRTEAAVVFTVFGVTGTSTLFVVRPCLKFVGIEGTMTEGPNSYRVLSVLLISPAYACMLMALGTLAGRHAFFASMSRKLLGRFFPASVLNKVSCEPGRQMWAKK